MDDDAVQRSLQSVDSAREALRRLLSGVPGSVVIGRPPSGKWSVLENLRHLLFAEQAHMARLFRYRAEWHPAGYTPEAMRAARALPPVDAAGPTIDEVWEAWDAVHLETVRRFRESVPTGADIALARHLRHLEAHVSEIGKLLRQAKRR